MLNNCVIHGRMTQDPELKRTSKNIPVVSFTIACDRDIKGKGKTRPADFIQVVAWEYNAEKIAKYFHRGSAIIIHGRLQSHTWTDKDGNTRYATEVLAENIYFAERKSAAK